MKLLVVYQHAAELGAQKIAHRAHGHLYLRIHEGWRPGRKSAAFDPVPDPLQEAQVPLDGLFPYAFGRSADDQPSAVGLEFPADITQPLPLRVVQPTRYS